MTSIKFLDTKAKDLDVQEVTQNIERFSIGENSHIAEEVSTEASAEVSTEASAEVSTEALAERIDFDVDPPNDLEYKYFFCDCYSCMPLVSEECDVITKAIQAHKSFKRHLEIQVRNYISAIRNRFLHPERNKDVLIFSMRVVKHCTRDPTKYRQNAIHLRVWTALFTYKTITFEKLKLFNHYILANVPNMIEMLYTRPHPFIQSAIKKVLAEEQIDLQSEYEAMNIIQIMKGDQ